jgi:hypothetical protein
MQLLKSSKLLEHLRLTSSHLTSSSGRIEAIYMLLTDLLVLLKRSLSHFYTLYLSSFSTWLFYLLKLFNLRLVAIFHVR